MIFWIAPPSLTSFLLFFSVLLICNLGNYIINFQEFFLVLCSFFIASCSFMNVLYIQISLKLVRMCLCYLLFYYFTQSVVLCICFHLSLSCWLSLNVWWSLVMHWYLRMKDKVDYYTQIEQLSSTIVWQAKFLFESSACLCRACQLAGITVEGAIGNWKPLNARMKELYFLEPYLS